jgi:hypothetical protein
MPIDPRLAALSEFSRLAAHVEHRKEIVRIQSRKFLLQPLGFIQEHSGTRDEE